MSEGWRIAWNLTRVPYFLRLERVFFAPEVFFQTGLFFCARGFFRARHAAEVLIAPGSGYFLCSGKRFRWPHGVLLRPRVFCVPGKVFSAPGGLDRENRNNMIKGNEYETAKFESTLLYSILLLLYSTPTLLYFYSTLLYSYSTLTPTLVYSIPTPTPTLLPPTLLLPYSYSTLLYSTPTLRLKDENPVRDLPTVKTETTVSARSTRKLSGNVQK